MTRMAAASSRVESSRTTFPSVEQSRPDASPRSTRSGFPSDSNSPNMDSIEVVIDERDGSAGARLRYGVPSVWEMS